MSGIEYTKDTGFSVDASGHVTWQRKMMLFGDSLIDILNSIELPQHGSRHPGNSLLRLTGSTCNEVGNLNGKCQALWEGTYTTSSSGFSYRNEKDPWDLAAQNLTSTPFSIREAMTEYWDEELEHIEHPLRNTANDLIEMEQELYGKEYSFVFCQRAKSTPPAVNDAPLLNSSKIKVAGVTIKQYRGLLLPISFRHIKDTDSKGNERSYYELTVTIKVHPKGWLRSVENVGVLACPKKGEPSEPIYRYTPWSSKDSSAKLNTKPAFGSLNQVIAAKNRYAEIVEPNGRNADGEAQTRYWNAWQELPYSEVTEPLYLDTDGLIDTAALVDGTKGQQKKFYEYAAANWSQFNLPSNKEE